MLDWWRQRGRLPDWVANATCALREDRGRAAVHLAASKARKRSVVLAARGPGRASGVPILF